MARLDALRGEGNATSFRYYGCGLTNDFGVVDMLNPAEAENSAAHGLIGTSSMSHVSRNSDIRSLPRSIPHVLLETVAFRDILTCATSQWADHQHSVQRLSSDRVHHRSHPSERLAGHRRGLLVSLRTGEARLGVAYTGRIRC